MYTEHKESNESMNKIDDFFKSMEGYCNCGSWRPYEFCDNMNSDCSCSSGYKQNVLSNESIVCLARLTIQVHVCEI